MSRMHFLLAVTLVTLTACVNQQTKPQTEATSAVQTGIDKGIVLLAGGEPRAANTEFNRALSRSPSNAHLHFLNALAYDRLAQESGESASPFAESGYRLALEFEPSHWLAAWHLGLLQVEQGRYGDARKSLATAARLRPRNADIQLALAGSAYLASDMPVALWAAEKTLALRPGDPEALRVAALSSAALGMDSSARDYSERFGASRPAEAEIVVDRIDDWKKKLAQAESRDSPPPPPRTTPIRERRYTGNDSLGRRTRANSDGVERLQYRHIAVGMERRR